MDGSDFSGSGTDSALRRELNKIMDEQARKAKIAFYMPTKEILEAAYRAFDGVPRIPDYDDDVARAQVWSSVSTPVEPGYLPESEDVQVWLDEEDRICLTVGSDDDEVEDRVVLLDPQDAKNLFLAGLAAVAEAERGRS